MLSFFRRGATEKVMLGVLVIALVAIVVTGFGTGGTGGIGGLAAGGDTLIQAGDETVSATDINQQVDRQLTRVREQQPEISTAQFLAGGTFEEIIRQVTAQKALVAFGRNQGLAASRTMIDAEIAGIPAFRNLAGQFDETTFRTALAQQRISEQGLRKEIGDSLITQQMYAPIAAATRVPDEMAKQYAALLLEQRTGVIGVVPAGAMGAGAEPSDKDVAAYYQRNVARYTIPERRVIRYAVFGRETLGQAAVATPAEIEAFYKANPDMYGAKETRSLSQVVFPTQAAAQAFTAKLTAGASFAQAAQQSGFGNADTSIGEVTKQSLGNVASAAVANAAFAVAQGAVTAAVQSPLGWHIIRVDTITRTEGRPIAAVTDEIRQQVEARKSQEALSNKVTKIEDLVAGGSSLAEVARSEGLTVAETPALTATGAQPGAPTAALAPDIQPLLKPAFEMEPEDDAEVAAILPNQRFAIFEIGRVVPAAAPPLAQIAPQVKLDFARQRAVDQARAVAASLVAKINGGVAPAAAFAQAGIKLPPPEQVSLRRLDISRGGAQVPPALALLFSLPTGRAQLIPAPEGQGWFVVTSLTSARGDVSTIPALVEATRSQFGQVAGEEYASQFINAVQKQVNIKRNDAAIARSKAALTGTGAP